MAGGGVTATVSTAAVPGDAIETDLAGMLVAKNTFLANLAVFRANDSMGGALLDKNS